MAKIREVYNKVDKDKLTVYIDREIYRKAKHKMIDEGVRISELLNRLLTDYVKH